MDNSRCIEKCTHTCLARFITVTTERLVTYLCTVPNRPEPILSPMISSSNGMSHSLNAIDIWK